jgi:preprotein translocase subunit YajC
LALLFFEKKAVEDYEIGSQVGEKKGVKLIYPLSVGGVLIIFILYCTPQKKRNSKHKTLKRKQGDSL